MKKPAVLVLDEALPKSTNDFSLSTISYPAIVKKMEEFVRKEKDTVLKLKAKHTVVD